MVRTAIKRALVVGFMKRILLRQTVELVAGVCGAGIVAIAISAIANPRQHSLAEYLLTVSRRIGALTKGDFGTAQLSGKPVLVELSHHIVPTLELLALGGLVALILGIPLGLLFALGPARRLAAPILQILTAMPVFLAGLALSFGAVYLLHWTVGIAPSTDISAAPGEAFRHALLPVATVGLAGAAAVQLALRRAAAKAASAPYRTGLKRLGLHPLRIDLVYVLPKVFAGLLESAGEIASALIAAAVVAEWVFHRPGAADLFVAAVHSADWPLTAVVVFFFAVITQTAGFLGRTAGIFLVREA